MVLLSLNPTCLKLRWDRIDSTAWNRSYSTISYLSFIMFPPFGRRNEKLKSFITNSHSERVLGDATSYKNVVPMIFHEKVVPMSIAIFDFSFFLTPNFWKNHRAVDHQMWWKGAGDNMAQIHLTEHVSHCHYFHFLPKFYIFLEWFGPFKWYHHYPSNLKLF